MVQSRRQSKHWAKSMEQRFGNQIAQSIDAMVSPTMLTTFREKAEHALAKLNSTDVRHRQIVLEAIKILIDKHISPLVEEHRQSNDSVDPFDLNKIAGGEIRGLVGSLFNERLKEQTSGLEKFDDTVLKEALEYVDVAIDDRRQREKFFKSWAAVEASSTIGSLIGFLKEPLVKPGVPKIESLPQERISVERLLSRKLSNNVESGLEILLNWIKQEI